MKRITLLIIIAMLVIGCSTSDTIESNLGISGAPDWVNEGTQAVSDKDGQLIQGIGMAPEMGDQSLQKSSADNRARAEVARVLSTFIESSISDYASSNGESNIRSVERDIQSVSQVALSGVIIKGSWRDEETGDIYSFAELDMKNFDEALQAASDMSSGFKDYFSAGTSANFERFTNFDRFTEEKPQ